MISALAPHRRQRRRPARDPERAWDETDRTYLVMRRRLGYSCERIARLLTRRVDLVEAEAARLGWPKKRSRWSLYEDTYLEKNHRALSLSEMAKELGRLNSTVESRLKKRGLSLGRAETVAQDDKTTRALDTPVDPLFLPVGRVRGGCVPTDMETVIGFLRRTKGDQIETLNPNLWRVNKRFNLTGEDMVKRANVLRTQRGWAPLVVDFSHLAKVMPGVGIPRWERDRPPPPMRRTADQ